MSDKLKNIVYLSEEQYQELMKNGSVTANGVTVQYSANDEYVTPDTTLEQANAYTDTEVAKVKMYRHRLVLIASIDDGRDANTLYCTIYSTQSTEYVIDENITLTGLSTLIQGEIVMAEIRTGGTGETGCFAGMVNNANLADNFLKLYPISGSTSSAFFITDDYNSVEYTLTDTVTEC